MLALASQSKLDEKNWTGTGPVLAALGQTRKVCDLSSISSFCWERSHPFLLRSFTASDKEHIWDST